MKQLSIFSLVILWLGQAFAQSDITPDLDEGPMKKVPLNEKVTTGKLNNGLKYFIMPNQKPQDKVELRLVVNAGSILENEQQRGLAHFVEHMAFNGSEHFKKNELVDYLQSVGVKFGAHLNAYTSFDETVYMLSLPSDDADLLEKGFLVLQDWAGGLLFDGEEIDKERGVVLEEYRLGLGASKRMMDNYLPMIFHESRYAERLPIGKKDILENFDHQVLKDFYNTWYRPNLMSVIVVGDISVEDAEAKIKSHFSGLTNPQNEQERVEYKVPDHQDYLVSVNSDEEAAYNMLQIMIKQSGDRTVEGTYEEFEEAIREEVIWSMLNDRLYEIAQKPGAPFSYSWAAMDEMWARTKTALQMGAMIAENKFEEAIEIIFTELYRAKMHGFTEAEFERTKLKMLQQAESMLKEQDKTQSRNHASRLVQHFLTGDAFPSPEWLEDRLTEVLEKLQLDELRNILEEVELEGNTVVVITGNESDRENMPDEGRVLEVIQQVKDADIAPLENNELPEELMVRPENTAKILTEKSISEVDAQSFTMSNGIRVIYKKTDLQNDQVLFNATSLGGTSLTSDEIYNKVRFGMGAIAEAGVGDFSKVDLRKVLSGKKVSVRPSISAYTEQMSGSCSPDDLEQLMQMVNLYFSQPRSDQEAYEAFVTRERSFMDKMLVDPSNHFSMKWNEFLYPNYSRRWRIPGDDDWKNTDYNAVMKLYTERFANPADFVFIFVGNVEKEAIEELATAYLGSLKTTTKKETYKDLGVRLKPGTDRLDVEKGSEPKSMVRMLFSGEAEYSAEEDLHMKMLGDVLGILLTEKLREEMSGVYGSGAYGGMSDVPYERYYFSVSFPCGPENVEALIKATDEEIAKLIENGPNEKELNKVKETIIKQLETSVQSNRYWMSKIQQAEVYRKPYGEVLRTEEDVQAVTAQDLQTVAAKYLKNNKMVGVLNPEK